MPNSHILFKNTATAAGDEFPAAKSNGFLQLTGRDRRAHTGMKKGQTAIPVGNLIDGMRTILPGILYCDPAIVLRDHLVDHFSEETDHTMLRQIPGTNDFGGLDQGLGRWIELEDG